MANEQQDGSQNPSEPKTISEDQLGNVVNAAVSSHLKRFVEKQLPAMFENALKPIQEKLSTAQQAPAADEKEKMKSSPEYAALQKQIEDLKGSYQKEQEARVAAEKRAREERAFSELKGGLSAHVRPELLDVLASNLFQVQQRVEFEEDGTPVFKMRKSSAFGDEDVRLPIKDGIDQFLKSDEAKPFLPAPSSGTAPPMKRGNASQSNGIDYSKPATSDAEKIRRAMDMEARAKARLGT